MFLFQNLFQQLCKACNFNCHIEIEGLFEVKGSHVHHTSGQGPSVNNESLSHIPFYSIFNKLPVISNIFALFTDVITTVCEKVANSIGFVYGPCIRVHNRVHGRVHDPYMAVYTAQ